MMLNRDRHYIDIRINGRSRIELCFRWFNFAKILRADRAAGIRLIAVTLRLGLLAAGGLFRLCFAKSHWGNREYARGKYEKRDDASC